MKGLTGRRVIQGVFAFCGHPHRSLEQFLNAPSIQPHLVLLCQRHYNSAHRLFLTPLPMSLSAAHDPASAEAAPENQRPKARLPLLDRAQRSLQEVSVFFLRPWHFFRDYRREYLQADALAGLTVALVFLPQAIAFALLAEMPPQMGLYAAIVASVVGALWGSSRYLQSGPTNTSALLVVSTLITIAQPGTPEYLAAAGLLAVMVGLFRLAMGVARLGILVNFVSDSVVVGFTAGAGALILLGQIRNLLRLNMASASALPEIVLEVFRHIGDTDAISAALGVASIILVVGIRRINRKIPGPLIALATTSLIVAFFGLDKTFGVKTIGHLPSGFPPFTLPPLFSLDLISALSPGALSIAAIGLVETISIARVFAGQTGQRLDSNQEFVGQGLANIACGFFSGYPTSGSFTRSALNFQAGAKTAMSSLFSGVFLLIAALFLAPLVAYVPMASLAGVLMVIAVGLIDRKEMLRIWRSSSNERNILLVTLGATILLPLHFAVLTGILMSLAFYLLKTSVPQVYNVVPSPTFEHLLYQPDRPSCPQLGIIQVVGDIYFGAVQYVDDYISAHLEKYPGQRYLLLRTNGVHQIDVSGIHTLEGIVRKYREQDGDVFITRYHAPVRSIMRGTGFVDVLGADHFFTTDKDAIMHLFYRVLDPAICIYECPYKVFKECQNLPKITYEGRIPFVAHMPTDPEAFIEPRELWEAMRSETPPLVIDVRERREYQKGHVPGALLFPLPVLSPGNERVPRDHPVVFVCHGGRRSARAVALFREWEYKNVRAMRGGLLAWRAAKLLEAVDDYDSPNP